MTYLTAISLLVLVGCANDHNSIPVLIGTLVVSLVTFGWSLGRVR